jgi:hypothetical protein
VNRETYSPPSRVIRVLLHIPVLMFISELHMRLRDGERMRLLEEV